LNSQEIDASIGIPGGSEMLIGLIGAAGTPFAGSKSSHLTAD
jgi:hypothetical protein